MSKSKTKKSQAAASCPPELIQLEQVAGQFMEYWGFKRIHGRIWVHLYTSKKPMDSLELMEKLSVSKGLMSLALRDLIDHQVIQVDHTGRHGTTYYHANPDLMSVITNVLRTREILMLGASKLACENLLRLKSQELDRAGLSVEKIQSVLNLTTSAQSLLNLFLIQDGDPAGALFSSLFEEKEMQ